MSGPDSNRAAAGVGGVLGTNPLSSSDARSVPYSPLSGRRTRRGDQTRSRILDASRTVFGGLGWHRARVEDVCRTAGVGHGTFYAYYANKVSVLEALVRQHAAALYQLAEEPWTSGDVRGDVGRVIAGFVELSEADRDIREIWAAAAPSEAIVAALVDEVRAQFVARVRDNLDTAVQAGVARQDIDVDLAAIALAAMVEHTVAIAGPSVGSQRLVAALTDLWVCAVYR
jgi:AcrR family transcriptional regulator